jgi:hypothetical protein
MKSLSKSLWITCVAALVLGTMGIGCGPKREYCPDAANGRCIIIPDASGEATVITQDSGPGEPVVITLDR